MLYGRPYHASLTQAERPTWEDVDTAKLLERRGPEVQPVDLLLLIDSARKLSSVT